MNPLAVAADEPALGRLGLRRITLQPFRDVVIEILLRPKDARKGLALNAAQVFVGDLTLQLGIEGIRLGLT
jgi:hypothetical protein